ncbi:SPOR domain-containing protein [Vibrio maritimus]|jgi:hypothetical protein
MKTGFAMMVTMLLSGLHMLVVLPVHAAMVCDSGSRSESTLPILESECPIGKGVWGQKAPSHEEQSFWIQCGFVKPGSLRTAPSQLQDTVNQPIWLKPDVGGDRCLVGPYQSFENAKQDLLALRLLPSYRDAFIRSTTHKLTTTVPQMVAKKQPPQRQDSHSSQQAVSEVAAVAITPYMIAGKHGHQDCLCLF